MIGHRFGGRHTDDKLDKLGRYLEAYSTALSKAGFALIYIDAFAGSGDRNQIIAQAPLFGEDGEQQLKMPGSARIALSTSPGIERCVFIERDPVRFHQLELLKSEFPGRTIELFNGDANERVRDICEKYPWHRPIWAPNGARAVLFLDPYGMEVEWATIEAIAKTKAIDLWCFFPLMGLYRNAPRDPRHIGEDKRAQITKVLGTTEWETAWYSEPKGQLDLLGDPVTMTREADVTAIERYVRSRLQTVFQGAVLPPYRIFNQRGAPLASLFAAIANPSPKAVSVATKIAGHILSSGNSSQVRPR